MSKAAELAAARAAANAMDPELLESRLRAEKEAPGLDGPVSSIPTDEEAAKEMAALQQMEVNAHSGSSVDFEIPTVPVQPVGTVHKPAAFQQLQQPVTPQKEPSKMEEAKEEKQPQADAIDIISSMPNGPSKSDLLMWKQTYPEVLFLPLKDDEIFVYRYLTYIEWQQIQSQPAVAQNDAAVKESVLHRCMLFPKYDGVAMNAQQAGLKDLLFGVIMESSYFITPQQAMGLVMRL